MAIFNSYLSLPEGTATCSYPVTDIISRISVGWLYGFRCTVWWGLLQPFWGEYLLTSIVGKVIICNIQLVGGLEHFLFSIIYGIILPIDQYFSEGLKPPTRQVRCCLKMGCTLIVHCILRYSYVDMADRFEHWGHIEFNKVNGWPLNNVFQCVNQAKMRFYVALTKLTDS